MHTIRAALSLGEELAPTRKSLLERLRDLEDQQSWQEFFETYWKLIYCTAVKAGLGDGDAEDVVQDTILSVARGIDKFHYDPQVCSFKGWLMVLTRHRIVDHIRKRRVRPNALVPFPGDPATNAAEEPIPDPAAEAAFERMWNEEWENNLVDAALEKVKRRISPEHYQIFYLRVLKSVPAGRVAEILRVSSAKVYVVQHRVGFLVQQEAAELRRAGDERLASARRARGEENA